MAELKGQPDFAADLLFPGLDRVRIVGARMSEFGEIVLTLEGDDVPAVERVQVIYTLRQTKFQRFVECKIEPA